MLTFLKNLHYSNNMEFSKKQINKFADTVRQGKGDRDYNMALLSLNSWREAHGPLMNHYFEQCNSLKDSIDSKNIIASQRLKRLPTILDKLNRYDKMQLARMHDIAGVRIIAKDISQLRLLQEKISKWDNLVDTDNYISKPRSSGYRGIHFIFEEKGMFVELQLRTQLQHLWSTAIETTDIFRGTSLKTSETHDSWRDFFEQASSIFAAVESTPVLKQHKNLSLNEICNLLRENVEHNYILTTITGFAVTEPAIEIAKEKGTFFLVITLNSHNKEVNIIGYKEADYDKAFRKYCELEQKARKTDMTVFASVSEIKKVQDAYPNFFLRLNEFTGLIKYMLAKHR